MASKYNGLSGSFSEQIRGFADMAMEAAERTVKDALIVIGSSVITLSPVDTGAFKGGWRFGVGSAPDGIPETPDPSGQQTIQRLVAQINAMDMGQMAYIVNNLKYAIPLEYGHSNQAPSGIVRVTLARFQQIVNEAAKKNQR